MSTMGNVIEVSELAVFGPDDARGLVNVFCGNMLERAVLWSDPMLRRRQPPRTRRLPVKPYGESTCMRKSIGGSEGGACAGSQLLESADINRPCVGRYLHELIQRGCEERQENRIVKMLRGCNCRSRRHSTPSTQTAFCQGGSGSRSDRGSYESAQIRRRSHTSPATGKPCSLSANTAAATATVLRSA